MSDQVSSEPSPQPPPTSASTTASTPKAEASQGINSVIGLLGLAMIGCFFLPWVSLLGGAPSGFELQKLPSNQVGYVWLIPGGALLACLAVVAKVGVRPAALVAGAIPYLALAYYCSQYGAVLLNSLQIGAWLTLIVAVVMLMLSLFLASKPKS